MPQGIPHIGGGVLSRHCNGLIDVFNRLGIVEQHGAAPKTPPYCPGNMQIQRIHMATRDMAVCCPAQKGITLGGIDLSGREQVALFPARQKQKIPVSVPFQLLNVQRKAGIVKLRTAVSEQG